MHELGILIAAAGRRVNVIAPKKEKLAAGYRQRLAA